MEAYKVTYPDSSSFVNREQRYCPICNKLFMAGAEGIQLIHPTIHYYERWFCSDRCADFYILSNMGPVGA